MNPVKALLAFYQSSIGKKWIVALTGALLVLFVLGHMLGNLQIFLGQETINVYAERLQNLGELLWVVRLVLLGAVLLHIFTTIRLYIENRLSRPEKYAVKRNVAATFAARSMIMSGLILISFIIFHILHYTVQAVNPEFKTLMADGRHDVYSMMILGFQNPWVSFFYILSVFLLALHMSHGIQSFLQTLGLRTRGLADAMSIGGRILSWAIFVGYASIPTAVLLGILTLKS